MNRPAAVSPSVGEVDGGVDRGGAHACLPMLSRRSLAAASSLQTLSMMAASELTSTGRAVRMCSSAIVADSRAVSVLAWG